ncbi:MAG TPA: hypothetical protein P5052_03135 [Candidatus Paceibacterota bacterium]|nr:hypothetical protein [Candidatus Paceibacterota bacterium]HRZ29723.1 hypothetical protein [Candidatus Paceibacterota bacterium]
MGKTQSKTMNFKNNPNFKTPPNGTGNRAMTNNIMGEIIEKNENSLTVKLKDNGSKIVVISNTTELYKTVSASFDDLTIGNNIMITGASNNDNSIIAESIRLVDDLSMPEKPLSLPQ